MDRMVARPRTLAADVGGMVAVLVLLAAYLLPTAANVALGRPLFAPLTAADTVPTCLLPVSLLRDGDLFLDEYAGFFRANWGDQAYFVQEAHGHLVSMYPVLTAILAVPVYAVPVWMGWADDPGLVYYVARLAAAVLAVIAMAFYYLLCREWLAPVTAAALTLALGLGTAMWTTVSQGLWQHSGSIPFLCAALWVLARAQKRERLVPWAGLLLSLATLARHNNATTLLVLGGYVLLRHRHRFAAFLALAALPLACLLGYNTLAFGSPLRISYGSGATNGWNAVWWQGLAGLLVSPAKGLLVFSPFLVWALVEGVRALCRGADLFAFVALSAWVFLAVMADWWAWYGGWSYGNRMLADSLPLWGMLLIPGCSRMSRHGWLAFGGAAALALAAHALGLLDYGAAWHRAYDVGLTSQGWLWEVKHSPIPFYAYHYLHRLLHVL